MRHEELNESGETTYFIIQICECAETVENVSSVQQSQQTGSQSSV